MLYDNAIVAEIKTVMYKKSLKIPKGVIRIRNCIYDQYFVFVVS
jgi:hypothetical protein